MCDKLLSTEEELKSIDILSYMHGNDWKTHITIAQGIDNLDGQNKRVVTEYRSFFGNRVKVLVLENAMKFNGRQNLLNLGLFNLNTQIISHAQKLSIPTKSRSYELLSFTKPLKSKPNSVKLNGSLSSRKPIEDEDLSTANISSHQLIHHSDDALAINSSQIIYKTLESVKESIVYKINKRSRYLKLGLLFSTTIVCIIITVLLIQTRMVSIESFKSLQNIYNTAALRSFTANLTLLAAELYLIDRGYSFNRPRETVQGMIGTFGQRFHDILKELNNIDESDSFSEYITDPNQSFWEYNNGEYINRPISLINIVKEITLKCNSLSNTSYLASNNIDFLELIRNGSDNWFHTMQNTITMLISNTNKNAEDDFSIVTWLSIVLGVVMVILLITIVGVPIFLLYKLRRSIWDVIFSMNRNDLISGEIKTRERLTLLHSEELENYERKHNISKRSIYRIQKGIYIMILLILVLIMGMFGFIFYYNNTYINSKLNLIDKTSYYYDLSGLHRSHFYRSVFFIREMYFHSIDVEDYPMMNEPYNMLEHSLIDIINAQKDILDITDISEDLYNTFYKYTDDGFFSFGMHALTIELTQSFQNIAQLLKENKDYYSVGGLDLETITFEYCDRVKDILVARVLKGTDYINDKQTFYSISTTTVYMICLMIYTILVLFPGVSHLRNNILTEFYILTLLPVSDIGQFISKLRKI